MDKNRSLKIGYELCSLVRAALNNDNCSYDSDNMGQLYELCCKHRLTALVSSVIDRKTAGYHKWSNAFNLCVMRKVNMNAERQQLIEFFRENNIWYMPMKGLVLQKIYPDPYFREMCDNDILYDSTEYKLVKEYMIKNGYRIEHASKDVHVDEYMKEPYYCFELHKSFFNITRGTLAQYYQNIFDFLINVDECEMKLSDEDFYVYMIAHSYKHFVDGGTGLRSFVDCYLYNRKVSYNKEYVAKELKKLGIDEFERKFSTLADKLFCGDSIKLTEEEEEMFIYVTSSGAYGTKENYLRNKLNSQSKTRYLFGRVFPALEWYKGHVPFCYKHRWAIPFYCVYRLFDRGIKYGNRIKKEISIVRNIDDK